MNTPSIPDIPGADALVAWFEEWPSFHDAEILSLHLNRKGVSSLKIHAWRMTPETDEKSRQKLYREDKHAVVTFQFEDIVDLELADFSSQNVIAALGVDRHHDFIRIRLSPCYGLAGHIDARNVSVAVHPEPIDTAAPTKSPSP